MSSTLTDQARAIASGQETAVEATQRALEAIERVQASTNAFTQVLADDAVVRAAALDRESASDRGPLHGVPVAVKDLFDVEGSRTTGCCAAYADRVAAHDAAVIERLQAAGAVVVAKTNQHELAFGTTSRVSSFGAVTNPWDPERTPGGSSGGSAAAVAAGAVPAALGTDTAGSVRIPASFCGLTGLKPTHGAVSLRGVMPLAPSLDTVGPLAWTAEDCKLIFHTIAGFDTDDPWSVDGSPLAPPETIDRLRVAVPQSLLRLVHPEMRAAVEQTAAALEGLGALIDEVDGPDVDNAFRAGIDILCTQAAYHYQDLIDDERVSPEIRGLLAIGNSISGRDYVRSERLAQLVKRDLEWALTLADVLLAPATPFPAPAMSIERVTVDGGEVDVHLGGPARLTLPASVAGMPALALPVGVSSDGLPLGGQLIGRPWAEQTLLTVGAAYQQATDWHTRRPPASS